MAEIWITLDTFYVKPSGLYSEINTKNSSPKRTKYVVHILRSDQEAVRIQYTYLSKMFIWEQVSSNYGNIDPDRLSKNKLL